MHLVRNMSYMTMVRRVLTLCPSKFKVIDSGSFRVSNSVNYSSADAPHRTRIAVF